MKPYYETSLGKLYHGNCMEVLPQIKICSGVIVSDPPYGISHKTHGQRFKDASEIEGDGSLASYEFLSELNMPMCVFYSPYNPPSIRFRSILVWNKGAHVGSGGDRETCWKRDIEMVGVLNNPKLNGNRDSASLNFSALGKKPSGHFCEKPIALMLYLIDKIPGNPVIDPYLGSGTTAIACEKLNRKWIGIEISEKYCEIAAKRIESEASQLKLFT